MKEHKELCDLRAEKFEAHIKALTQEKEIAKEVIRTRQEFQDIEGRIKSFEMKERNLGEVVPQATLRVLPMSTPVKIELPPKKKWRITDILIPKMIRL